MIFIRYYRSTLEQFLIQKLYLYFRFPLGLISRKHLQLPNVQQMYSTASDILGFDLLKTSLQGSSEEFSRLQIQHPAVLVASLVAVER